MLVVLLAVPSCLSAVESHSTSHDFLFFQALTERTEGLVWAAGSRLLVSASNSVHYLFSTISPWTGPIAKFTGHIMGSFYIKTAFSPDGSHIASGSSDNDACIWAVRTAAVRCKKQRKALKETCRCLAGRGK